MPALLIIPLLYSYLSPSASYTSLPHTSLASYSSTYEFGLELYFKLSAPLHWTPGPPACRSHCMTLFIGQNRLWRTAGWKLCILWNFTELCHGPSVSSNCYFPSFTIRSLKSLICVQRYQSQHSVTDLRPVSVPAQRQRSQPNVSGPNRRQRSQPNVNGLSPTSVVPTRYQRSQPSRQLEPRSWSHSAPLSPPSVTPDFMSAPAEPGRPNQVVRPSVSRPVAPDLLTLTLNEARASHVGQSRSPRTGAACVATPRRSALMAPRDRRVQWSR